VIPLYDINPTRRFAWVTVVIILLNVGAFLLWQPTFGSAASQEQFLLCHAEIPYEVTHHTSLAHGGDAAVLELESDYHLDEQQAAEVQAALGQVCPDKNWVLSVFEAMFLHGGWLHIAGNMLFLWIFGNNVEDRLGRVRFVIFYLLGGLAAAALEVAAGPNSTVPSLGASGAIAAILGSYLVMFPRARVKTLVFFLILDLRAEFVLLAWFVLQLFNGLNQLGTSVAGGVAYWAHIGGFVFGVLATLVLVRRQQGPSPPWRGWSPS
jgi:membrane associated rhomboid family serine protease